MLPEPVPYVTNWTVFKHQLENFFQATEISSEKVKRAILLDSVNQESYQLLVSLCHPLRPECTPFNTLLSLLDQRFTDSLYLKRLEFFNARRYEEESLEDWIGRVESLARDCQFGSELNEMSKEVFLRGLNNASFLYFFEDKISVSFEEAVDLVLKNRDLDAELCTESWSEYSNEGFYNQHQCCYSCVCCVNCVVEPNYIDTCYNNYQQDVSNSTE